MVAPGPVSATGLTNTGFSASGIVTNDPNGKLYTTPTIQNALLANSAINFSGTPNQITGGGSTALGGTATAFGIANPLVAPGPVSVPGLTNTGFAASGVVTNDANGKTYTTPTLQNALLANSSLTVAGTANQVSVSGGGPVALGGTVTLSLPSPTVYPGAISATGITNTAFTTVGVVTNDASGKMYTAPKLPTTLVGTGNGVLSIVAGNGGNSTLPISASYFFNPQNTSTNTQASDLTAFTRMLLPVNCTVGNLRVLCSVNPGAVANTVTIFTNGVASGVSVAMNNVTSGSDTTHSYPLLAGWEVGIKIVTAGSGTAVRWSWAFTLQ